MDAGSDHSEKITPLKRHEDDVDVAAFAASPEALRLDPQVAARLRFVEVANQLWRSYLTG